jgi:hypothetical protein
MKQSINFPDWLRDEVADLAPGLNFSDLVKDALLLALPGWRKSAEKSPVELELRVKLRLAQATADRVMAEREALRAAPTPPPRSPAVAAPLPGARRARPKPTAKKSATTVPTGSPPKAPETPKRGKSRRN